MQHFKYKKTDVCMNITAGFTVIEALVAISILLIAVSGSFAAAQSSLQSSNFVKNRVTAYYLAQEGIEYIRHIRDNNGLSMRNGDASVKWLDGVIPICAVTISFPNTRCRINAFRIDDTLVSCSGDTPTGACKNLSVNNNHQFNYGDFGSGNVVSGFNRTIKVEPVLHWGNDNAELNPQIEVKVTSTVTWIQAGVTKSLNVSENLYNWQQL